MNAAAQLLARLAAALPQDVGRAHGMAVLEDTVPVAAAGWDGRSWAAPVALARRIAAAEVLRAAPLVLSNDPYAGGTTLGQLFLLAWRDSRRICVALDLADFGAMRPDVFCRQREVFHEGLRLSLLAVTPGSGDWAALARLIAANVKRADAVLGALEIVWAVLHGTAVSSDASDAAPPCTKPAPTLPLELPVVAGKLTADGRTLQLDCQPTTLACSPSTVAGAALSGVAAARDVPPWQLDIAIQAAPGPLAPLPPAAVGDGAALAAACWQAGYAAADGRGTTGHGQVFAPLADWTLG